jgi:MFS transporter, DHA1 family, multidrug resistance protein
MRENVLSLQQENKLKFLFFILPFLIGLSVDMYVPSLPAITTYYNIQINLVQFTITFYLLGYSAGQVLLGTLSDYYGRKVVLVISCIFYTLISFISAFSPNIYFLIVSRFIQGIAIAGLGSVVRAVATDNFTKPTLNKMISYISLGWSLGPIIGPFLGAYLQYYFNWKGNFIFLSLYGAFLTIYIILVVPETNKNTKAMNHHSLKEVCLNIKTILLHPVFFCSTVLLSFIYGVLILFSITGPFLIENVLKYSVIDYGYMAIFLGFGYFSGCYINKFAINYIKPHKISISAILSGLIVSSIMIILGEVFTIDLLHNYELI